MDHFIYRNWYCRKLLILILKLVTGVTYDISKKKKKKKYKKKKV